MPDRTCRHCGCRFQAQTNRANYCTESCYHKWRFHNLPGAKDVNRKRKEKLRRGRQAAGLTTVPKVAKRCEWCDAEYETTRKQGRWCSNKCYMTSRRDGQSSDLSWAQCGRCEQWRSRKTKACPCPKPEQRVYTDAERAELMKPRPCACCGEVFTPKLLQAAVNGQKTCSARCTSTLNRRSESAKVARRHAKDRRRARKKGAFVARVYRKEIYERDGHRCQLCGDKLKMDAETPHPLAPTIDHIVPLAAGGVHAPWNVQAAHFICNSRKGDRHAPKAEQLRLAC